MKPLLLFITAAPLFLFAACSSSQQSTDIALPALVYQEPLPSFPRPITTPTLRIPLQIHVKKDGTVDDVRIVNSSGSIEWDSAAISSIRLWRYSPARINDAPINIWLNQTAIVTFSEPLYMTLAGIYCNSLGQADTVYGLLKQGVAFDELAKKYSLDISSTSFRGPVSVNIQVYPAHIKKILTKLSIDQFTEPVPYGDRYAIFKRFKSIQFQ